MRSFSQRLGLKPIRTIIQRECADEPLRNNLWNALTVLYLENIKPWFYDTDDYMQALLLRFWVKHYGLRKDELDSQTFKLYNKIKQDFLNSSWNEMFDILEFFPNNYEVESHHGGFDNQTNKTFVTAVNEILKKHLSAYSFIDKQITEISSEEEIASIEDTLNISSKFNPIRIHIKRALELYSDRINPDYRNSIKESISAIESFSCIITNNPKASLGQALKEIEKKHDLHTALKNSFSNLYGYTSDGNGIRHALLEESNLKQEDAKFMLVTCSAFVNYLLVNTNEV